jgi:hypothetical protein
MANGAWPTENGQRSAHRACVGIAPTHASSPVFFVEAPGRPVFLLFLCSLAKASGMARQGALPFVLSARGPSRGRGAPLGAPPRQACAVRAYLRASSFRRRAALFVAAPTWTTSVSQAPGGRPVLATRRSPGAARVRACEARPRAPHPVPPSDASRRRPSMSRTIGLYS